MFGFSYINGDTDGKLTLFFLEKYIFLSLFIIKHHLEQYNHMSI